MKACVLNKIRDLIYTDVPCENLKQGHILLKVKACGICSSDIDRINHSGAYHYPIILGHEIAGEIIDVANDISREYIGKRAVVFPLIPCKKCENCNNKDFAQCDNYDYFGSRRNGGFAEYMVVPIWNIKTFVDKLDYETAVLCEPASVAKNALSKIDIKTDKNILIVGTGTIGILIGLWGKLLGYNITFLCRNSKKEDFLKMLDFKKIIDNNSKEKFDVCMECVGTNESIDLSIKFAKTKGKIILIGNPKGDINLDKNTYWKILRQELNISGIWNSKYEEDWEYVLNNLNKIPAEKLITHKFKLSQGIEAINILSNPKEFKLKGIYIID